MLIGLLAGFVGCANPEKKAFERCTGALSDSLLAPTTAVLPDVDEAEFEPFGPSGDSLEVRSHVDAQNAFGALVRTYWVCWVAQDSVLLLQTSEQPRSRVADRAEWEAGRAAREAELQDIQRLIDSLRAAGAR